MTKICPDCHAEVLSTPNRMGTTPEMQKMYDQFGALTDEIIDLSLSEFFDVSPRSDWTGAQRVAMRKAIQTATPDGDDVLRDALGQIAGKNDLSGVPDDDLESAARNALYECELIARAALAATPGGEITDAMLNAAAIEWTRMCNGYPYAKQDIEWPEFFGRMFKAALAAQPASPLRGEAMKRIKAVCEDNAPASCNHKMALDFVLQIATAALASPPEQPAAEIVSLDKARLVAAYEAYWENSSGTYTSIECAILSYLNSGTPEQPAADSEDEPGYGGRYGLQRRPNKENK